MREDHRLSHPGYQFKDIKVNDEILARETINIDPVIGGYSRTFFDLPVTGKNETGSDVLVNQVGWAGIILGKPDFEFSG